MSAATLADLWTRVGWQQMFRPRLDVWRVINVHGLLRRNLNMVEYMLDAVGWAWLLDTTPARRTLAQLIGGETLHVSDGSTLVVSVVEQATAEVVRFTNTLPPAHRRTAEFRRAQLGIDHLLASAAVPLLFPPGRLGDHEYVDAGLVANTPLKPALAYEPDALIVVSASGIGRPAPRPASLGDAIGLLADNVAHFALLSDYRHAQTMNTLVDTAPEVTKKKHVELLLIAPRGLPYTASAFMHFDPDHAPRVIAHGRAVAERALAQWPVRGHITAA
jgi:NTE family protein